MSKSITQVNYDELQRISKSLQGESEEILRLHSATRQKVEALRGGWTGEAANAFFREQEGQLLPAVQRVSRALNDSGTVLNQIMQIIHAADEETAAYFKGFNGPPTASVGIPGIWGGTLPTAAGGGLPSIAIPISVVSWSANLPAWLHTWVDRFFPAPKLVSPLPDETVKPPEAARPATGFGALLERSQGTAAPGIAQAPAPASSSAQPAAATQSAVATDQTLATPTPKYDVYNDVPVKSQGILYGSAACALTSVSMVLDYFHNQDTNYTATTPETLKDMLDPGDGIEGTGVALHLMTDDLNELGYKNVTVKMDANMDDLTASLKDGPVIVTTGVKLIGGAARDIQQAGGTIHAMVVKGLNASSVVVNDPWSGGEKVFSRATFDKMWSNGQQGMYVIRP